jgi:hypothetical protein
MITKSSFVIYKCCQHCEHSIKNSAYKSTNMTYNTWEHMY